MSLEKLLMCNWKTIEIMIIDKWIFRSIEFLKLLKKKMKIWLEAPFAPKVSRQLKFEAE